MKIVNHSVEIMDRLDQDAILKKLEKCGRVCYKSEDKATDESAEKFIRSIIHRGHESVLEHVSITVKFITDRAIANELTRHRIASYSQESTRYVKYKDDIEFIMPVEIKESFKAGVMKSIYWKRSVGESESYYRKLIEIGEKPENARATLPLSTKTELVMTADVREWRHVIKLRISSAAHPDMRYIMGMVLDEFLVGLPVLFDDIRQ